MDFRIADTFDGSLRRLTGDEQRAVKTTAYDLMLNRANPGMSFHRLDKARDRNFWSVRASSDIRIIVHRTHSDLLLCYVDHHDRAYALAKRRKLETHPKTGAAHTAIGPRINLAQQLPARCLLPGCGCSRRSVAVKLAAAEARLQFIIQLVRHYAHQIGRAHV